MASKKVFADTNYWVAIVHPADPLHEIARQVSETLGISVQIWTTQMVLTEFLNIMAKYGQHLREMSARLVNTMHANGVQIITQTPAQFEKSFEIYEHRSDKGWGLTDCASYAAMRDNKLCEALTEDHHFEQMGFVALLRTRS